MISRDVNIRVRYQETDCMGVVNHMNYINYFEVARTELLRSLGTTYRSMEEDGIMLPVFEVGCKYHKSAYYDDLLTVRVTLRSIPSVRIRFDYEVFRGDDLLTTGFVTLAFVDGITRRPCRAPRFFLDILAPYFA